jgi:hypothetical protein
MVDKEQDLDIYISKTQRNWVIKISLLFSLLPQWQTKEEKYIQPYLDKGMNVVNLNYRLKPKT